MAAPSHNRFKVACAALVVPALAGCGAASTPPLTVGNRALLRREITGIRTAIATHDRGAALARISTLEGEIGKLRAGGQLARTDAAVLRVDATQLRSAVSAQLHVSDTHAASRSVRVATGQVTTTRALTQAATSTPAAASTPANGTGSQDAASPGPEADRGTGPGGEAHHGRATNPGGDQNPPGQAGPGGDHGPPGQPGPGGHPNAGANGNQGGNRLLRVLGNGGGGGGD